MGLESLFFVCVAVLSNKIKACHFKPQGALKLLLFRLPKDIQKANDKMVSFFFFLLAAILFLSVAS